MCARWRDLVLQFECRSVEFELEQLSHEFEQQCGVPLRLQILKLKLEKVELQGCVFPALCEINQQRLFGRPFGFEDQVR